MQRIQLRYQKILLWAALGLSALTFFYALGFATDLYSLNYHIDKSSTLLYVEGAELFKQIQPFNRTLLRDALILLLLSLATLITRSHVRRLYYLSNYLTQTAFAVDAAYFGATLLVNAQYIKAKYLTIDFARMEEITDMLNMRYVKSTFMLDAGIALSIILMVLCAAVLLNLLLKTLWMRKERALLRGEAVQ